MVAKIEKLNDNISDEGRKARDKELIRGIKIIDTITLQWAADCRLYMSRSGDGASPVYCNLWIHGGGIHGVASGKAGGYGYDKRSSAVSSALDNLGVKLYQDDGIKPANIAGVGDDAIRTALMAVAVALGYSVDTLIYVECYA